MEYKVLAESLTGMYGKTHYKGDVIAEDQIQKEHITELITQGAIEISHEKPEGEYE